MIQKFVIVRMRPDPEPDLSRLPVQQRAPGSAGPLVQNRSDPPFSSAATDGTDLGARGCNTYPPAAAPPPTVGDSSSRIVELLGVSPIGTASFPQILQRFFG